MQKIAESVLFQALMSNRVQVETIDLDLNQDPSFESEMTEIFPWLNELETSQERIEERIIQLEAIVSRIRQPETTTPTLMSVNDNRDSTAGVIHERSRERFVENGDDKTYLIAKALNMENPTSSVPVGFFDCNICLKKAKDPILTCCGHLFCWVCFYQLPLSYLNIKECPVCDGEVTDTEVIPIYGNGDDGEDTKSKFKDSGICLPPRPTAKRIESVRQKIVNRTAAPFVPVHETIEHIRRTIDSIQFQNHSSFGPLRLLSPQIPTYDETGFDVGSFVDGTSLRRNRRRSSRIAEISRQPSRAAFERSSSNVSQTVSSLPGEFTVPDSSRNQTVNPTEMVSSVSSTRRRTDDVNNGPLTRSRRRLR